MKTRRSNHGIVFWITGLPGSGKTNIAKNILKRIEKDYGPTLHLSGDEVRKMLRVTGYTKQERFKIGLKYHKICRKISELGVNVLFDVVCLIEKIRKENRKYLENYLEIFIKADGKILIEKKKKYFYKIKTKNVWGIDIKPEFPKKPEILINNNFKKTISQLSNALFKKIHNYY